jgi:hypothetical protein
MRRPGKKEPETVQNMDNWKAVYITPEKYLAEMAGQMLRDNGIEAVVLDKLDSAYPSIGHIEVMVEKDKVPAAEQLIKEFEP